MTFLHPILAAAAVACVSVPIIIHILMRRRRKPVMWAAMRFLLEAYRQNRRRLRLEQILLLAARCLLVALAGLAIARPLMGSAGILGGRGAVTLYVLIDDGLAASATGADGVSALDRHKKEALALLDQLDPASGDRAALIALGGPARGLVVPPSAGVAAVREAITNLSATDSATDIPGGLAIARAALDGAAGEGGRTVVAVLSDYLAGSADTQRAMAALVEAGSGGARRSPVVLLSSRPAAVSPANTTITGLEPLQPILIAPKRDDQAVRQAPVRVQLRRSGDASGGGSGGASVSSVRFAVEAGGRSMPAGQATVRWAPGQTETSATARVDLTGAARAGGGVGGSVVLIASLDADPIEGDNTYRRPVEARQALRVGLIAPRRTGIARPGVEQYEPADWFRLALQPIDPIAARADAEIEIAEIEPSAVDAARLAGLDAAIIPRPDALPEGAWKRLRAFADAGGLIVVSPPARATVHLWFDAMAQDLGLPWSAAREARAFAEGIAIVAEKAAGGRHDMLAMLDLEIQELVGPVRVRRALPIDPGGKDSPVLLRLADGTPLVLAAPPGGRETSTEAAPTQRGLVVMLSVAMAIEWTDLQTKPLMVALMQELVRQGVGRARGTYAGLAGSTPEAPPRSVELRAVSDSGGHGPTVVKVQAGHAAEPIRNAGLWKAVDESGASRGVVAINADPAGARTEAQPAAAIAAWLAGTGIEAKWLGEADGITGGQGGLKSALSAGDDAARLALPLLIAALALAMVELGLGRWFSHAVKAPAGTTVGGGGAAA